MKKSSAFLWGLCYNTTCKHLHYCNVTKTFQSAKRWKGTLPSNKEKGEENYEKGFPETHNGYRFSSSHGTFYRSLWKFHIWGDKHRRSSHNTGDSGNRSSGSYRGSSYRWWFLWELYINNVMVGWWHQTRGNIKGNRGIWGSLPGNYRRAYICCMGWMGS